MHSRIIAVLLLAAAAACGPTGPNDAASISISPDTHLLTEVGERLQLTVTARNSSGRLLGELPVEWVSSNDAVAEVSDQGRVTAVGAGTARIDATVGSARSEALVEVYLDRIVGPFLPGSLSTGREGYVEYYPGDLPLVISAPHGGDLTPDEVADRQLGVVGADRNTRELTMTLRSLIIARTGRHPHVIVSRLHRSKLDPNREIVEAAQNDPFAEQAWREFHEFTSIANQAVADSFGTGLYLDMHGHGHPIPRIELGYLLSAADLGSTDTQLNDSSYVTRSSVRSIVDPQASHADVIRGPNSFGALLEQAGFPSVPSPSDYTPGSDPYFSGGYNTRQYGSRDGGPVSAIQIEAYFTGARDTDSSRHAFATAIMNGVESYLQTFFGLNWNTLP